ncbi:unnamed protein product [Heligmosomoides polygyrus]|uniref:Transposase n=1 Tax=Heligmosomoides polygyrus TaxID=6339 RepID=A0A183FE88_HELPZ|nr:unnamed protein product [Heligmosomoides polygyrus]
MVSMLHTSVEGNRRAAIIENICTGCSPAEIIRFFGYPRSTACDVVVRYNASEESEEGSANPARKTRSRESVSRTAAVVEKAQELILEDPKQSLRILVSVLDASERTMRRIPDEDLQYKSYTANMRQLLSEAA